MRPITRRSTLALPVEGWAWALTSVGTRRSIGRRNTNRFDFQDRVFAMVGPLTGTGSPALDDVLGLEILQVARVEAQPLGVDLGVVLAEQRRAVHRDVRVGHLHRPPGQGELAALGMVGG